MKLLFIYLLIYHLFIGITTKPIEGDSIGYHIPIAKSIINQGVAVRPENLLHYYPSATEVILSLFIFFKVPLNLYNVLALVFLFLGCWKLGLVYGLKKRFSVIFAASVSTLPVIVRWIPTQVVDIWVAVFFVFSLILLQNVRKGTAYFLTLGFLMGMLLGSKYSGPFFGLGLLIFFGKNIWNNLSLKRLAAFALPVFTFGVFWYVRNWYFTGNPIYPQGFLSFKGDPGWPSNLLMVWQAIAYYPKEMLDALFSEYLIWPILILISLAWGRLINNKFVLVGIFNLVVFLFLPSFNTYNVMVSNFRFSYPAFIPLILGVFLAGAKFKKEGEVSLLALTNMVVLSQLSYHPKLLLLMLPVLLFVIKYGEGKGKDENFGN